MGQDCNLLRNYTTFICALNGIHSHRVLSPARGVRPLFNIFTNCSILDFPLRARGTRQRSSVVLVGENCSLPSHLRLLFFYSLDQSIEFMLKIF